MKQKLFLVSKTHLLFFIFIVATAIGTRFLFFPGDVYFGFDQARDAYASQAIYTQRDVKLIGPSTAWEGLFHGPLYWYLIGPVYLLFDQNPIWVSAFLRLVNVAGIGLLIFLVARLFSGTVALISAFLFAVSYDANQLAVYFANPAPAIISILLFYLGWYVIVFENKKWGWLLVGGGFGLSVQFEFFLVYLMFPGLVYVIIFWQKVRATVGWHSFFLLGIALVATLSSFIAAELKYRFQMTQAILSLPRQHIIQPISVDDKVEAFFVNLSVVAKDNLMPLLPGDARLIGLALVIAAVIAFIGTQHKPRLKLLFVMVWLVSNAPLYVMGTSYLSYANIGIGLAVIVLSAFLFERLRLHYPIIFGMVMSVVVFANLQMVWRNNRFGPDVGYFVQERMLLGDELRVIDYIYGQADGQSFSVNALTMPYRVKTTWAYLFNTYGLDRYQRVPDWSGEQDALGYPGVMPLERDHHCLRFSIIESTRGIPGSLIDEFLRIEGYFSSLADERDFGVLKVQKRWRMVLPPGQCRTDW